MLKKIMLVVCIGILNLQAQGSWLDEAAAKLTQAKASAIKLKNTIIEKVKKPQNTEYHKTKALLWTTFGLLGLYSARLMQLKLQKHINDEFRHIKDTPERAAVAILEISKYAPFMVVGLHSAYKSFEKSYEHIKAARQA